MRATQGCCLSLTVSLVFYSISLQISFLFTAGGQSSLDFGSWRMLMKTPTSVFLPSPEYSSQLEVTGSLFISTHSCLTLTQNLPSPKY